MANPKNLYFHSAEVYLKPTRTNPTPRRVGVIQEISIEIKRDLKELFGERKYAEDVASGNESISGKYKAGEFDPAWLTDVFLQADRSTGVLLLAQAEQVTIATGTATVANAANYREDYGVVGADGTVYTRVAATPAVGQYAVNETTGVYTFNTTENGNKPLITYLYNSASGGETLTVNNTLAGDTVFCSLLLRKTSRAGSYFGLRLANATFESMSFGFKLNEYTMPEGAFKGFAGANGKVFEVFRGN